MKLKVKGLEQLKEEVSLLEHDLTMTIDYVKRLKVLTHLIQENIDHIENINIEIDLVEDMIKAKDNTPSSNTKGRGGENLQKE